MHPGDDPGITIDLQGMGSAGIGRQPPDVVAAYPGQGGKSPADDDLAVGLHHDGAHDVIHRHAVRHRGCKAHVDAAIGMQAPDAKVESTSPLGCKRPMSR